MSLVPVVPHQAFDPEAIEVMSSALAKLCEDFGLSQSGDRLTQVVAKHVIEAATQGIRSAAAIRSIVVEQFTSNPQ